MKSPESIFIKCQCGGCSILEINADEGGEFYIALWSQHQGQRPMSKKERIRWCANVMKTGNPWADHTIVSQTDAQRIIKFLTKKKKHGKNKTTNE